MNKFWILFKKEVKALINVQTIAPLVLIFVLFYFLGNIMGSLTADDNKTVQTEPELTEETDRFGNYGVVYSQTSIIGFIDKDNTEISKYIKDHLMYLNHNPYNGIIPIGEDKLGTNDPEEAMKKLKDYVYIDDYSSINEDGTYTVVKDGVEWKTQTLVVIPEGFEANLLAGNYTPVDVYSALDSFGLTSMIAGASSYAAVDAINGLLSQKLYEDNGGNENININFIKYPVYANDYTYLNNTTQNVNASMVLNYVTSQLSFVPIIIMIIILMAATMLATSMVTEKADKTLETLMTAPISRISVLMSKILSAAVYAAIYAVVYIYALNNFNDGLSSGGALPGDFIKALENFGITFDLTTFLIIGAQLFLSVLCGLAIALIIGMMIDDVKALQSYIMPLMIFIMIPYFLSMFMDINTLPMIGRIAVYIIPFTHTFTAAANLFVENYTLIIIGIIYQAIFVAVLLTVAVKIFNSDKLFTLGQLMKRKPGRSSNSRFSIGKWRIG